MDWNQQNENTPEPGGRLGGNGDERRHDNRCSAVEYPENPPYVNHIMTEALSLARLGMPVFPCRPNKVPYVTGGFKSATTGEEQIRAWWAQWPEAMVGVPTGPASGFWVLDIDCKGDVDGFASLAELEAKHGPLPATRRHGTPSGGQHLIFKYPAGRRIGNSASKLGPGLDVRGAGGYVVIPPSTNADGKSYTVADESRVVDAPTWLLNLVASMPKAERPGQPIPLNGSSHPWVAAGLGKACSELAAMAPDSGRNDALNQAAFRFFRFAAGGCVGMDEVEAALLDACRSCGLPDSEARKTVTSAKDAALKDGPLHPPEADCPRRENQATAPAPTWPEAQPLVSKIEPIPYPTDALPENIRAAVAEVQGFVQAPFPLVASSALGALSLACQAHVDVQRAERLEGPSSLFFKSIADSGERKTTIDGFFMKAIRQHQSEEAETAKPLVTEYKSALGAWEAEKEGILAAIKAASKASNEIEDLRTKLFWHQAAEPVAPRVPRMVLGDETPEHLAWSLAKIWPSAGVISSEAGVVFGSHGMSKDSIMRNLALLNILWDGGELSIGRRTSEPFTVRGARLTVALQIQEATLREFFEKNLTLARGSGFLARFLLTWPESTQGTRRFKEAPKDWPRLEVFNERLLSILKRPVTIDDDGALSPTMLRFTPEAKASWVVFHDAIEEELSSGGELYDVRDVAAKVADNAARLAALFHVFEHGTEGAIGVDSFESASRIVAWHLSESRRFFGELALPVEMADAARLDAWLLEHCRKESTRCVGKNHVRRYGPLRDGKRLDRALEELIELDRIQVAKEGKRRAIHLNPALLGVAL